MSTNHDLYLDLCAALTAGSIDPNDRRVLEEHLDGGCAECLAFLRDLSGPIEALARSVPAAKPSRGLKARVMVAVAQSKRQGPGPSGLPAPSDDADAGRTLPIWAWVVIVALALAAAFGWWRATLGGERERAPEDVEKNAPGDDRGVPRYQKFVAGNPAAQRLRLERTSAAPPDLSHDLNVEVVYDAGQRRAAVRVTGAKAPPGRVLELWTVRNGKPHSEGLIPADGVVFIENTGDPAGLGAFAVSVEPPQGAQDRETPSQVSYAVKPS